MVIFMITDYLLAGSIGFIGHIQEFNNFFCGFTVNIRVHSLGGRPRIEAVAGKSYFVRLGKAFCSTKLKTNKLASSIEFSMAWISWEISKLISSNS